MQTGNFNQRTLQTIHHIITTSNHQIIRLFPASFRNEPVITIPIFKSERNNPAIEKSRSRKVQTPLKTPTLQHEISRRFIPKTIKNPDKN
jgi:hypothetical protein